MVLNNDEMFEVKGGGFALWAAIGSAVIFVIGVIDGIVNPQKCN